MVKIRDTFIDETKIESIKFVYDRSNTCIMQIQTEHNAYEFDDVTPTERISFSRNLGLGQVV